MRNAFNFIFLTFVIMFASFTYASSDCAFITKDTQFLDELTDDCHANLLFDISVIEKINKTMFEDKTSSSDNANVILKGEEFQQGTQVWEIFLVYAVGTLALLVIAIGATTVFFKFLIAVVKAATNSMSIKDEMGLSQNAKKISIKIVLFLVWFFIVSFACLKGIETFGITYHNIWVVNEKTNTLKPETYLADKENKAKKAMESLMPEYLKLMACSIDLDKQIIEQQHIIKNNFSVNEDDKYLNCMQQQFEPVLLKQYYKPTHTQKVMECGKEYAAVHTASCGGVRFKDESIWKFQSAHAIRLQELEPRMLKLANEYIKYYCSNQLVTTDEYAFNRYCYEYNPLTSTISLDDNGKIISISSSMTWSELQQETKALEEALRLSLEQSASLAFDSINIPAKKTGFINFIVSLIQENETLRFVKNVNSNVMNIDVNFEPEFRNKEIQSNIKSTQMISKGLTRTTSSHFERVEDLINSVNEKSTNETIKDLIFEGVDFLGQGYFENLGYQNTSASDYNIIASTLSSGVRVGVKFLQAGLALKSAKGAYSILGSNSLDGKPNLNFLAIENTLNNASNFFFLMAFTVFGAVVFTLIMIFKSILVIVFEYFFNVFKILTVVDLPLMVNSIDGNTGSRFNYNDIIKKLIMIVYVFIAPTVCGLLSYLTAYFVNYFVIYVAKSNFFLMNLGSQVFLYDASSLTSIVMNIVVMILFFLMVMVVTAYSFTLVMQSFNEIVLKKLNGSQDNQANGFLSDLDGLARQTQSAFGQYGKMPRRQRL